MTARLVFDRKYWPSAIDNADDSIELIVAELLLSRRNRYAASFIVSGQLSVSCSIWSVGGDTICAEESLADVLSEADFYTDIPTDAAQRTALLGEIDRAVAALQKFREKVVSTKLGDRT